MIELYIIGAGSVGGHIASNWEEFDSPFQLKGFLDDNPNKHGQSFCGYPVFGSIDLLRNMPHCAIVIGIAFPKIKIKILNRLKDIGDFYFPSLVSPNSWISKGVQIGEGSIIYPGTCINYGTRISDFVVINMNCAIGHDVLIEDFSSLAPGVNLGGHTHIGSAVELGIGSATKQFITIQDESVIGGQAMVIHDIPRKSLVAGVPAKSLKEGISIFSQI